MTSEDFPPSSWLGRGLDLTAITPCDINTVTQSVLSNRLIGMSDNVKNREFYGVKWTVPDNVVVAKDVQTGESSFISYTDGGKAALNINNDSSLASKYMAVSGGLSGNYSVTKSFRSFYQYVLFSFNQNLMQVKFDEFSEYINERLLSRRLQRLDPFNPSDLDLVARYQSLFRSLGSHVITGASYGGRLQLTAWASNSDDTVNQNFVPNIHAAFNGLTNGGKFDGSIISSNEYKIFSNTFQKICSCLGGDPSIARRIDSNPTGDTAFSLYQQWAATSHTLPGVMHLQTMALWDLMEDAEDSDVADRAVDVRKAYEWIVANPKEHVTNCRFVINSDWGEIGLLTPSAIIKENKNSPYPRENIIFSTTKILWGREHSHQFQRDYIIDFQIVNDGSPIDFVLSHGSDGSTVGSGQCAVSFSDKSYENKGVKDNNWNTMWFYQKDVNPNVSATED